ncbi:MAG: GAF domain-containing protein, partial [Candidatus Eisenbacteria bacterium]|nr:GAF domain-containing protein [Candidatus Eisenbacteria bacterium]
AAANEVMQVSRVLRLRTSLSRSLRNMGSARIPGEVCRAMVEEAGYAGAWIGIADHHPGALLPLATAGLCTGLADAVIVPSEDDGAAAPSDPVAEALRRRQPVVSLIHQDERLAAWAPPSLAAGGACGVLPLEMAGRPGVLVLVSAAGDTFCGGEVEALSALAADITAALLLPASPSDADAGEGMDRRRPEATTAATSSFRTRRCRPKCSAVSKS